MTSICGGYTTLSAFSLQSLSMFQKGAWLCGGSYVIESVALSLVAVRAEYALATAINTVFDQRRPTRSDGSICGAARGQS